MGTIVNTLAVAFGSLIGLLLGRAIPERLSTTVMRGLGLCTIYLGLTGFQKETHPLVLIMSIIIGAIIGELADLDGLLNRFGDYLKAKLSRKSAEAEGKNTFTQGFVTANLVWCAGAMTILGCIQDGMQGDPSTLYAKSGLDLFSSIIFASSLGPGVLAASGSLFLIQGSMTLMASSLAPYFTAAVIADISSVGSLLLLGLGFNILGISQLKVMNYVPACFVPVLLHLCGLVALL